MLWRIICPPGCRCYGGLFVPQVADVMEAYLSSRLPMLSPRLPMLWRLICSPGCRCYGGLSVLQVADVVPKVAGVMKAYLFQQIQDLFPSHAFAETQNLVYFCVLNLPLLFDLIF